jgi:3-hydroxyacyl-[acyl-carrier-protein] dehydratase
MRFSIAPEDPCLDGHFPGAPLVPGVVLLERVLAAAAQDPALAGALYLPQVKFVRPLRPGVEAEVVLDGGAGHWRFQVLAQGQLLASGQLRGADDE